MNIVVVCRVFWQDKQQKKTLEEAMANATGPKVTFEHMQPPIMVKVEANEFPLVVQQLTGKGSTPHHQHIHTCRHYNERKQHHHKNTSKVNLEKICDSIIIHPSSSDSPFHDYAMAHSSSNPNVVYHNQITSHFYSNEHIPTFRVNISEESVSPFFGF